MAALFSLLLTGAARERSVLFLFRVARLRVFAKPCPNSPFFSFTPRSVYFFAVSDFVDELDELEVVVSVFDVVDEDEDDDELSDFAADL